MSNCGGSCGGGGRKGDKKSGVGFPACGKCEDSLADWTEGEFIPIDLPPCPVCARQDIAETRSASPPPELFIIKVGVTYPYDGSLTLFLGCPSGHRVVQKFEVNALLSSISWTIREHEASKKWS